MRNQRLPATLAAAAFAIAILSLASALPAAATIKSTPLHGPQVVTVNVSFSTQVPLTDLSEDAIAASQKSSRTFIYGIAKQECAVLKTVIAKTCRLTGLNVSSQIQNYNNQNPIMLNINGNANFAISLESDEVE